MSSQPRLQVKARRPIVFHEQATVIRKRAASAAASVAARLELDDIPVTVGHRAIAKPVVRRDSGRPS